jgi:hypothetical protein
MKIGTMNGSKIRRCAIWMTLIAALFFWDGNGVAQSTQGSDVAGQFPDVNRVVSDYPDDAERFVALNVLWNTLHEKSPTAPEAVSKRSSYYNASSVVSNKYMVVSGKAADDYSKRVAELTRDRKFTRSVLDRYHLNDVAAGGPMQSAVPTQMRNTDVTDSMIQEATVKALPYLLITLVAMYLLAKVMVRNTAGSPSAPIAPAVAVGNLPSLPESLRVVKVPGLQYAVESMSGLVLEKETTVRTSVVTTTTPGEVYTIGNDVYTAPGQTRTSATSTKEHTIWLRTPDGRETSWTFTGDTFKMRPGHIISVLARRLPRGIPEFILAYNHATDQLEEMSSAALRTRNRWAWLAATLVGSIGFAICIFILLSIQPDPDPDPVNRMLAPVADWIEGLIPAAIVALIVVMKVSGSATRRRYERFAGDYLPKYLQFFQQATGPLQRHFAAA